MSAPLTPASDVKIFCVGAGKTGTTSLKQFVKTLGFRIGAQDAGKPVHRTLTSEDFVVGRGLLVPAIGMGPGLSLGAEARCAKVSAPACCSAFRGQWIAAERVRDLRDCPLRTDAVARIVERRRHHGNAELAG